jgi:hypothetical protein
LQPGYLQQEKADTLETNDCKMLGGHSVMCLPAGLHLRFSCPLLLLLLMLLLMMMMMMQKRLQKELMQLGVQLPSLGFGCAHSVPSREVAYTSTR